MTRMSVLSTADMATWAAHGHDVRQLPTPTPLHLLQLPLARMQRRLSQVDTPGAIAPPNTWERFHTVRGADGYHYAVRIAGDPRQQLPIQGDAAVLMAVLGLYDEQGWRDRQLVAPPMRRMIQLMGIEEGGPAVQRIKAALTRYSLTRASMAQMRKGDDPVRVLRQIRLIDERNAADVRDTLSLDESSETTIQLAPTVTIEQPPTAAMIAEEMHQASVGRVHSVLDVTWGKEGIASITLGPAWFPDGGEQAAAWIDFTRYFSLKNPLARRLYELFATSFLHQPRGPWEPSFEWLRNAVGYDPQVKRNRVVREFITAGEELHAHGFIEDLCFAPTEAQAQAVSFTLAPVLNVSRLLVGFAMTTPPDDRTMLALLRSFRFTYDEAETAVRERPERTREALCFLAFRRSQPAKQVKQVEFPNAWLKRVIWSEVPFDQAGFAMWYSSLLARATNVRPAISITGKQVLPDSDITNGSGGAQHSQPLVFGDDDWGIVLRKYADELPETAIRAWLIETQLESLDEQTAVISCPDEFNADWVGNKYSDGLAQLLSEQIGRPVQLRFKARHNT